MQSAVFVARVHGSVTLPKSFPALAQNATIKYEKPVPRPGEKRRKFVITQSFAAHAQKREREMERFKTRSTDAPSAVVT
jgi:hypothetical protein